MTITPKLIASNMRYLQLLSHSFPTIADASTEIINLEAILNLPKGTEHFLADLHGEYEAFQHVLKNASGNIKRKVNDLFGNELRETEKKELCTLSYYPDQKLELVKAQEKDIDDWYHITLHQLVRVCRDVSSKYTRSKVRKSLPEDFSYIIEELLHESTDDIDQQDVLGDVYDRGPGAHIIMETLANYHSWDIQWGNHDDLWMGACAGNDACICNVIRMSLRYANLQTLEDGYGINLLPLATFAMETYKDDPCEEFKPIITSHSQHTDEKSLRLAAMMHKAITIIQFKAEAAIYERHPEWEMNERKVLNYIDLKNGVYIIDGKKYEMKDKFFPTLNPDNPNALTGEEATLLRKLHHSFSVSEKLHKHIRVMLSHGCMYAIFNSTLLFHASVPLNEDGTLKKVEIYGKEYSGKELLHHIGLLMRTAFNADSDDDEKVYAIDYFLYLWCGKNSPLFDKSKMATFERYFLTDKETYKEKKGNYFKLRDNEDVCDRILDAFEVEGDNRHIINGHVPVHAASGENPIKANGKLMLIDGGFSQTFHKETGIAGYTLVYHSRGFQLVQHEPFTSAIDAIKRGTDIVSTTQIVEMSTHRMLVNDTDKGKELQTQIDDLKQLLYAYRHGFIKEKRS